MLLRLYTWAQGFIKDRVSPSFYTCFWQPQSPHLRVGAENKKGVDVTSSRHPVFNTAIHQVLTDALEEN